MITESLDCWLIHKRWTGETSADLTLFTKEYGLLNCRFRGCRTTKKQSVLIPFTPLCLVMNTKKDWHFVKSLELIRTPYTLMGTALFSALYVNELIYYTCRAQETFPNLFEAYQTTIDALSKARGHEEIEQVLRLFEVALLKSTGYEIMLTHDVHDNLIQPGCFYQYVPGEGLFPAGQGIDGQVLLDLAQNRIERASLSPLKMIMRQAIDHLLDGRPIKARSLFSRQKKAKSC